MKKLAVRFFAVLAIAISTAVSTFGQNGFAYQAVIRDGDGKLVSNKQVEVKFTLLHDGNSYYAEKQSVKTNEYGNIQVTVGAGEKLDGDYAAVPWNTLDIKMSVAVDVNGTGEFLTIGEVPIQSSPYALYAQKAGGYSSAKSAAKGDEALFSVNDANGNPVFAVFNSGIVVYVDDTDSNRGDKALRSGFVVKGRSATKDGDGTEYFAVTADGTHIYVDDPESNSGNKALRSGFVVKGRSATKEGEQTEYLAVGGDGTTVYVDDADNNQGDKALRSGFVVKGRSATKDGEQAEYFAANTNQTTVYVDGPDSYRDSADKALRSGFVVKGRSATKDDAEYLTVGTNGTQVFIDGADSTSEADKALRSGFVVKGRSATKDDETLFAIEGGYTRVYVDDDEDSKALRSGFVVKGRSATKEEPVNYVDINGDSINIQTTDFRVMEAPVAANADSGEPAQQKNLLTISAGNVLVDGDFMVAGDLEKKVEANAIDSVEMPAIAKIVDRADTISCSLYKPFVYGDQSDAEGYALLGIYSKGSYAKVTTVDASGNMVLLIDAKGNVTKRQKNATVAVLMAPGDSVLYIRPLKATHQTISFGLMKKNATQPYQYIKLEAEVEAKAGVPFAVNITWEGNGAVTTTGSAVYGEKMVLEVVPEQGNVFAGWSDGNLRVKRTITVTNNVELNATFEHLNCEVNVTINNNNYGQVEGAGTYFYGDTATLVAVPNEGHSFIGWKGVPDSIAEKDTISIVVKSDLNITASFMINQYTLTFVTGCEPEWEPITADYGTEVGDIEAPAREGYEFADWNKDIPEFIVKNDTIVALWDTNAYDITFVLGQAEWVVEDVKYGTLLKQISDTVKVADKKGYSFSGWQTSYTTMPDNAITVTGEYEINKYDITFKVGETTVETISKVSYGTQLQTIIASVTAADKKGYTFDGWQTESTTMPDSAITIKGNYTPIDYTITFVTGNGEKIEPITAGYEIDITEKLPTNKLTMVGYEFAGWSPELPSTMPFEGGTYVAQWVANKHNVTFMVNSEQFAEFKDVEYNSQIPQPESNPEKEGHEFVGWNTDASATAGVTIGQMPDNDVAYYAIWSVKSYALAWDYNSGILDETKPFTTAGQVTFGTALTAPTLSRAGYTPNGWSPSVASTMPAQDQTYTAQWTANKHNVTFMVNGEQFVEFKDVEYNTQITVPENNPEKEGHEFVGWNTDASATAGVTIGQMPDNDIVYYAIWSVKSYALAWNYNSGILDETKPFTAAGQVTFGTALTAPTLSRAGYTPNGWSPSVASTMPAGNQTYTAQWTANTNTPYTVIINKQNINDDGYTPETITAYGTTDTETNYEAQSITGFTAKAFNQVNISGDGFATLTVNYDRVVKNAIWSADGAEFAKASYRYEQTIMKPADDPTKTGHSFIGWTGFTEGTKMGTEDVTFTAEFSKNSYAVTVPTGLELTGDVPTPVNDKYLYEYQANVTFKISDGYRLTDGGMVGYTCNGTTTTLTADGNGNYTFAMPDAGENGVEITATGLTQYYTVTFVTGNGASTIDAVTVNSGQTIAQPENPTRNGYTFLRWLNGTDEYNFSSAVTSSFELTAEWKPDVFTKGNLAMKFGTSRYHTVNATYIYYSCAEGEYLYLMHSMNLKTGPVYEYRNYYVVDGNIYEDNAFAGEQMNASTIENALQNGILQQSGANGFTENYYNGETAMQNLLGADASGTITTTTDFAAFSALPFATIAQKIAVNYYTDFLDQEFSAVTYWTTDYSLTGTDITSANIVSNEAAGGSYLDEETMISASDLYARLSLAKIQPRFDDIRNGFDIVTEYDHGTVAVEGGKTSVAFGETVTLTAATNDDEYIFAGWADNNTDNPRTMRVTNADMLTAMFEKPVLYVSSGSGSSYSNSGFSANAPVPSIEAAFARIPYDANPDNWQDWEIRIMGKLQGNQKLNAVANYGYDVNDDWVVLSYNTTPVKSITIVGHNGLNNEELPQDTIDGGWITYYDSNGGRVWENDYDDNSNFIFHSPASALAITGITAKVVIKDLVITRGYAEKGGGIYIADCSDVTFDNGVIITKNYADDDADNTEYGGGGVYLQSNIYATTLTIKNGTEISYNTAMAVGGGGIVVEATEDKEALVTMQGGTIKNDTSSYHYEYNCGGGGVLAVGAKAKFIMNGGSIEGNFAEGHGGGVCVFDNAVFEMNNNATIKNNTSGDVWYDENNIQHIGSDGDGGGVEIRGGATFTMKGGSITGNHSYSTTVYGSQGVTFEPYGGGGVCIINGIFDMQGGRVSGNDAMKKGSGVTVNTNAYFQMSGTAIVDANNDVYLMGDRLINVVGPFTFENDSPLTKVATITPSSYSSSKQVLSMSGIQGINSDIAQEYCNRFAVTADNGATYGIYPQLVESMCIGLLQQTGYGVNFYEELGGKLLNTITVQYGNTIPSTEIPTLTKDGYRFLGWFVLYGDNVLSPNAVDLTMAVTGNIQLVAKWGLEIYVGSTVTDETAPQGSAENPYSSILDATNAMSNGGDYVIYVVGELGQQQIPSDLTTTKAKSLTILGTNSSAKLGEVGILSAVPVSFQQIEIVRIDNENTNNQNVELGSGAKVKDYVQVVETMRFTMLDGSEVGSIDGQGDVVMHGGEVKGWYSSMDNKTLYVEIAGDGTFTMSGPAKPNYVKSDKIYIDGALSDDIFVTTIEMYNYGNGEKVIDKAGGYTGDLPVNRFQLADDTWLINTDGQLMKAFTGDLYVSPQGANSSDENDGKSSEQAFKTFDRALTFIANQTKTYDYIIHIDGELGAVTLANSLDSKIKSITLMGESALDDIINGGFNSENQGHALTIGTTKPVVVDNLSITGGYHQNGGGVYVYPSGSSNSCNVTFGSGVAVVGNTATQYGGGVYAYNSSVTFDGARIGGAQPSDVNTVVATGDFGGGGGIFFAGGNPDIECVLTITGGSIVDGNTANGYGGGVYVNAADFVFDKGSIRYNVVNQLENAGSFSQGGGGGVYINGGGTFTMSGTASIANNETTGSTDGGAGVLVGQGATFNMQGGTISSNKAIVEGAGVKVYYLSATFNMTGGTITGNTFNYYNSSLQTYSSNALGKGVYVGGNYNGSKVGTFKMSGTATVDETYLTKNAVITVDNPFTFATASDPGTVTTIAVPSGSLATTTVVLNGSKMDDENGRFAVKGEPITGTEETTRWGVAQTGYLVQPQFAVVFRRQSGDVYDNVVVFVENGQTTEPIDLNLTGKDVEWYTEAAYTNLFDFSTPITSDMSLYGKEFITLNVGSGQTYATLNDAFATMTTEPENYLVKVHGTVEVSDAQTINDGVKAKSIVICGEGQDATVSGGDGAAISVDRSFPVTIRNLTIDGDMYGLAVSGVTGVTIESVKITGCESAGIMIWNEGNSQGAVTMKDGCEISGNGEYGVYSEGILAMQGGTIADNGEYGVYLADKYVTYGSNNDNKYRASQLSIMGNSLISDGILVGVSDIAFQLKPIIVMGELSNNPVATVTIEDDNCNAFVSTNTLFGASPAQYSSEYSKFSIALEDDDSDVVYRIKDDGKLEECVEVDFCYYYKYEDNGAWKDNIVHNPVLVAKNSTIPSSAIPVIDKAGATVNPNSTTGDFVGWYEIYDYDVCNDYSVERLMVFDASQEIGESKTVVGVWNETIVVSEGSSIPSIADAISKMDRYCAYTIKVNGTLTTPQSIVAETDISGYSDQSFYSITIESYGSTKQAINLGWTESNGEWTNTNLDDPEPALTINTDDTIIIKNLIITGGYAQNGGGIFIDHNDANVIITDGAEITGNGAIDDGGGVYASNSKLTMNGTAKIENNTAGGGDSNNGRGGGVYLTYATFKMGGGTISGNEAKAQTNGLTSDTGGYGGGVCIGIGATMYMYGNAVVGDASAEGAATAEQHSNAANCGGGVYVEGWSTSGVGNLYLGYNGEVDEHYNDVKVTLTGGIYYNYAVYKAGDDHFAGCGGGVNVQNGHTNGSEWCVMKMASGNIAYNAAEIDGGGIYLASKIATNNVSARFTMSGGSVSSNNAGGNGKGVYVGWASNEKFAIFNISGGATLAADNDVFLAGNQAQINIDGELSNTNVATITPATYATTVQVLGGNAGAIAASCGKFAVTPNGGAVDWIVNTNGYLQIYKPEGGLGGKFSVDDGKQVYFSQGNLQYLANNGEGGSTWRFAENQWIHIGNNPGNTVTGEARATQSDWIDLFGWGTSGHNNDPYMIDQTGNYGDGANDIAGTQYDWGVKNPISNGGDVANKWRTLKSGEWTYLLKTRTTSSGLRYAMAQVQGVNGLVLLPDNWSTSTYTFSSTNPSISNENWSKIEAAGAVFLPVTGYRMVSEMYYADLYGNYWSSSTTSGSTTNAGGICFDANDLTSDDSFSRYFGRAVRLVQDVASGLSNNGNTIPEGFVHVQGTATQRHVQDDQYHSPMTVDAWVCQHLVTQAEYEEFMTYYGAEKGGDFAELVPDPNDDKSTTPAYYVSWADAVIYCNLLSKRDGLDPVYSIYDETDPDEMSGVMKNANGKYYFGKNYGWEANGDGDITSWDDVADAGGCAIDLAKSGWRLANPTEYMIISDQNVENSLDIVGNEIIHEWSNVYAQNNASRLYFKGDISQSIAQDDDYAFEYSKHTGHNWKNAEEYPVGSGESRNLKFGFRIVRNAPVQNP